MSKDLFSSIQINKLTLKNRLMMTALGLEIGNNGVIDEKYIELYRSRAKGGVGSVVIPSKIAHWSGKKYFTSLTDPKSLEGFRKLSDAIHEYDCKLFVQLFHAGRNMLDYDDVKAMAPSAIPSPLYRSTIPKEMTKEDICRVVQQFAEASVIAKNNGIDGVELNCCAGYLLSSFLSPLANKRTDEYGGSEENRIRITQEVLRAIKAAVGPDYPVIIRVSAQLLKGGYDLGLVARMCHKLDEENLIDGVAVIGGWHESPIPLINYYVPPAGYAHFGGIIKRSVKVPVIMNVRIHSREAAQQVLDGGFADIIGGARPYIADANFAECLEKGEPFSSCVGCNKGCIEANFKNRNTSCVFNPTFANEYLEKNIGLSWKGKHVLVAGGGVGGMYAAYQAARRGAQVTLYEGRERLGGKLYAAATPPGKEGFAKFVGYMMPKLEELGVKIVLGQKVNDEILDLEKPDFVVVAVGSEPVVPGFAKTNEIPIMNAEDVLQGGIELCTKLKSSRVAIIGGGAVGLETADYITSHIFFSPEAEAFFRKYAFAEPGDPYGGLYVPADVTVIEMMPKLGNGMGGTRYPLLQDLKERKVKLLTSTSVQNIESGAVNCKDADGNEIKVPADHVILSVGYRALGQELEELLSKKEIAHCVIGDASKARDVQSATVDAYQAFLKSPEAYGI